MFKRYGLPGLLLLVILLNPGCVNLKVDKPLVDLGDNGQSAGTEGAPADQTGKNTPREQQLQNQLQHCNESYRDIEKKYDKLKKQDEKNQEDSDKLKEKIKKLEETIKEQQKQIKDLRQH